MSEFMNNNQEMNGYQFKKKKTIKINKNKIESKMEN